jgi:hypothetical protein
MKLRIITYLLLGLVATVCVLAKSTNFILTLISTFEHYAATDEKYQPSLVYNSCLVTWRFAA